MGSRPAPQRGNGGTSARAVRWESVAVAEPCGPSTQLSPLNFHPGSGGAHAEEGGPSGWLVRMGEPVHRGQSHSQGLTGLPGAWLLGLMQLILTSPPTKESRADHCVKIPERSLSHVVGGKMLFHECAGSGTNMF